MLSYTHAHANRRILLVHMHSSLWLWDASSGSQSETGDWHPLVSTSVTLPAACEVGTEQQSEALGNICGQLHGEEGAKERNLLLINKIMGAIRPFSHHRCSVAPSLPLLCFCLRASPALSDFRYKNYIHCLRMEWKDGVSVRKKESRVERGGGKGMGWGGCWSSNQQLTGVRMFMGRVSLSDWSSSQFSCGLKHSFPLILKLRRKKERKTKKKQACSFSTLGGRKSVHTKIKGRLSVCKLNCLTATTSFLQLGSPSAGPKAHFLDVRVCQNRSRWLTAPSYLPHPDFNKFDSSLSAFPRITERCGWADMKTPQWDFKLGEKKKNAHPQQLALTQPG